MVEPLPSKGARRKLSRGKDRSDNLYRIPNIRTDAKLVYTNKSAIGAYRGYGNPQCSFAYEAQLDMIAEKLGIDPMELRLKNASRQGDTSVHGWQFNSCGLVECIETVAERSNWKDKHGKRDSYRAKRDALAGVAGAAGPYRYQGELRGRRMRDMFCPAG